MNSKYPNPNTMAASNYDDPNIKPSMPGVDNDRPNTMAASTPKDPNPNTMQASMRATMPSTTAEQIIQMIDENTNFTEEEKKYLKKTFEDTNVYKRRDFLNYLQRLIDEKEKGQGKTGGYKKRRGKTLRKKKNRRKTKRIRWR